MRKTYNFSDIATQAKFEKKTYRQVFIEQEAEAERQRKEQESKAAAELKAKQEAEKKAANAPDIDKINQLKLQLSSIQMPDVKGEEAKKIVANVQVLIEKVTGYITDNVNRL